MSFSGQFTIDGLNPLVFVFAPAFDGLASTWSLRHACQVLFERILRALRSAPPRRHDLLRPPVRPGSHRQSLQDHPHRREMPSQKFHWSWKRFGLMILGQVDIIDLAAILLFVAVKLREKSTSQKPKGLHKRILYSEGCHHVRTRSVFRAQETLSKEYIGLHPFQSGLPGPIKSPPKYPYRSSSSVDPQGPPMAATKQRLHQCCSP